VSDQLEIRVDLLAPEVDVLWKLVVGSGGLRMLLYLTNDEILAVLGNAPETLTAVGALARIRDAHARRDAADPAQLPDRSMFIPAPDPVHPDESETQDG
jgi:hypothetical protein